MVAYYKYLKSHLCLLQGYCGRELFETTHLILQCYSVIHDERPNNIIETATQSTKTNEKIRI